MESNGTALPPANLDWLTVSPKAPEWLAAPAHATVAVRQCNELKVVFDGQTPVSDLGIQAQYYYLQPCDVGDANRNAEITSACIAFIKQHPRWRLSLQTHKLVGIR
jgi:organic radical activating enzyme